MRTQINVRYSTQRLRLITENNLRSIAPIHAGDDSCIQKLNSEIAVKQNVLQNQMGLIPHGFTFVVVMVIFSNLVFLRTGRLEILSLVYLKFQN